MKKLFLVFVIIFFGRINESFPQTYLTPSDFQLKITRGQIDKSKMTSNQKDTILIDMYNYEDDFFDIAVLYKSNNEIIFYKNCINGNLTEYKKIKLSKEAHRIENDSPSERDLFINPTLKSGLKIIYSDNTTEKISNYKINKISDETESKVPIWNFLEDARVFVYDISFVESWRSERNGSPHRVVICGDIDNDGKNEMIYTFFPVSDSIPLFYPQRIVVFESIGNNQYRIDWDTISYDFPMYTALRYITDFDRNGHKEFFAVNFSQLINDNVLGLFECSGEGKYKFYRSDELSFQGPLRKVITIDTVNFFNRNAGMHVCFSSSSGPSEINALAFISKSVIGGYYFRRKIPQNIQLGGFTYDMEISDFNNDGKIELILGDTQFSTNYIAYLDSTGNNTFPLMQGYEFKEIIPNAPVSAGWLFAKDLDGDNKKEIITCGIGSGSGSIGVVKSLGGKSFQTMWWDSSGIFAGPNLGIDSASVDGRFSILYPNVRSSGSMFWQNTHIYTRSFQYGFFKTFYEEIDSTAFLGARLFDIDMDKKVNILTSAGINIPSKFYYFDFEQQGTIGIWNNVSGIPPSFSLYQNYPNPFNNETILKYDIRTRDLYKIEIFDITGKKIETILKEIISPGEYKINFNSSNLSSGVYFYKLSSSINSQTRKLLLIK